mgnify:CR=1 FL=1
MVGVQVLALQFHEPACGVRVGKQRTVFLWVGRRQGEPADLCQQAAGEQFVCGAAAGHAREGLHRNAHQQGVGPEACVVESGAGAVLMLIDE